MFKKKERRHQEEIYPKGKHRFPSGQSTSPSNPRNSWIKFPRFSVHLRMAQFSRSSIEKLFMICIFIVLEAMVGWLCFNIMGNTFDSSDFPKDIRGFLKLVQVALFVIFTYAAIMVSFFKVNIFQ